VFRALFLKHFLRYKISAFPVIAFVGNDGGGKTSTIGELSSHTLHKIDPIVVSMKRKDQFFVLTKVIKAVLIPLKQNQRIISVFGFLSGPANWILEVVDYFDRLVRFRLGLLWARCGLGPVFFDRYVTDRLRGEYRRDNFRLHPLEQFFPMPDSFIFFDVPAEVSVERKPEDNHNLIVLREKRVNYLLLMNEISRVHYIDGTRKPVDVHESANVFILSMCRKIGGSKIEGKGEKWERALWTPN
jgi:thymidylate kinase